MGSLFYRNQPINVINSLRYAELKYWNEWHELMVKADKKVMESARGKK